MARYFFQVSTDVQPDKEGAEFRNDASALRAAVQLAGAIMEEGGSPLSDWALTVTDAKGKSVASVNIVPRLERAHKSEIPKLSSSA